MPSPRRRSLASLLIGVIAALGGMWVATWVRSGRCLDAGGRWTPGVNRCELPAGVTPESLAQLVSAYLLGLLAAVAIAFLLWRVFAYASGARPAAR
ncbi:MAG: hypothetical protein HOQ11_04990 [Gemmatimonadaceae bacterium]|nr:hypothetical protein [Gemmatimonadaceae bacterium]NUQ93164.1 hypothetical protein [Gemmatimonadaceae bacterium]NUR19023.1 hypothetical protein [Gemmatimonadaceae bacterium]NUS96748.1 hypothetical protein [Gemmatimonadaceae bacterium]